MSADAFRVDVSGADSPPAALQPLASLHSDAFQGLGRAWTIAELSVLCTSVGCTLFRCSELRSANLVGFALVRMIGDEAEILTICRAPNAAGRGVGGVLLDAIFAACRENTVRVLFLEVSSSNKRAQHLYIQHGFLSISLRKGYYPSKNGNRVDAIVMRKLVPDTIDG